MVIWGMQNSNTAFLSKGGSLIRGLSVSPDGSLYAVCLLDNTIRIYNSSERTVVATFSGFKRGRYYGYIETIKMYRSASV